MGVNLDVADEHRRQEAAEGLRLVTSSVAHTTDPSNYADRNDQ